jgi:hypothetical protein
MLAAVHRLLPHARILAARDLYTSSSHWRRLWPQFLPHIDVLVAFDDGGGLIGAGVFQEVSDARCFGIPVYFLQNGCAMVPLGRIAFQLPTGGDATRYVRVVYPRLQVPHSPPSMGRRR